MREQIAIERIFSARYLLFVDMLAQVKDGVLFPCVSLDDCRQAFTRWNDHNASRLGAALAFYTLLSLAPLLLFVVAMVAFVFGQQEARSWIIQQVTELIG